MPNTIHRPARLLHRLGALLLGFACGLPALAQVVSAPDGPRVGQAANGVPVVDINAPNARGISHNRYQQFNVDRQGLILNNQTATGSTTLAGQVLRNDRLQGRAAGLIVNEVTGTAPSSLRGYMEVAGQRAGVVVANPNGISCDGCGFINTPQATLSTGVPQWAGDGSLQGYAVSRGAITVDGQGLDASGSDRLALIARAMQINAGIWAEDIAASSGAAQFNTEGVAQQALAGEGTRPQVGIDVAALGGMYAGRIRLLGNEHGVGVASAGELISRQGQLRIDSAGNLRLTGTTQAERGAVQLQAAGDVQALGRQAAAGAISVQAGGMASVGGETQSLAALQVVAHQVQLSGRSRSNGLLTVQAGDALQVSGEHWAGQGMTLRAGGDATLDAQLQTPAQALLQAGGALGLAGQLQVGQLQLQAAALHSAARIDAAQAQVTAATADFSEAALLAADDLNLQIAGVLDNRGLLLARQRLLLQAQRLHNAGELFAALALQAQVDALDNSGRIGSDGSLQLQAMQLRNSGQLAAASTRLQAGHVDNRGGVIGSTAGTLQMDADVLDNSAGTLRSAGDLALEVADTLHNADGSIDSDGVAQITAQALHNQRGRIVAAAGSVRTVQDIDNHDGLIGTRDGDLQLEANQLNNQAGSVQAAGHLRLHSRAQLNNQHGRISAAQLTLRSGAGVDNRHGQLLASAGDLRVTTAAALDNRGGTLGTQAGDIHVHSGAAIDNSDGGTVLSAGALQLAADGVLRNAAGRIDSAAAAQITAQSLDNHGGRLVADAGALQLTTVDAVDNREGTLGSIGAAVTVDTARLRNEGGQLIAGNDLRLQAGTVNNGTGLLQAGGNATLVAQQVDNRGGQLLAGKALQLQAQALDNRTGLLSAADIALQLDTLDNQQDGRDERGVFASGELQARLAQLRGDGRLFGSSALRLRVLGDYQHDVARLQSNGLLALDVAGTLTNLATLSSPGQLQINAAALDNRGSLLAANSTGDAQLLLQIAGVLDNRGRLGGDHLQATATQIHNTGTVLGNQVQLRAAQIINGRDLGQSDNNSAPYNEGTLAAVHSLQLDVDALHNLDGLIYSGGDLQIGGQHGGSASVVENVSGLIQAEGALQIAAHRIDNRRRVFETETHALTAEEQAANQRTDRHTLDWEADSALADACEALRLGSSGHDWRCKPGSLAQVTDTWTVTHLTRLLRASAQSQLLAGGGMHLQGDLHNHTSTVAAGGTLDISGQVDNIAFAPQVVIAHRQTTQIQLQRRVSCGIGRKCWRDRDMGDIAGLQDDTLPPDGDLSFIGIDTGAALAARMTSNGAVDIRGPGLSNGIVQADEGVVAVGGELRGGAGPGWSVPGLDGAPPVLIGSPDHPLPDLLPPDNGLFTQNRAPTARYLVETDPRFTEYGQWIASDYLLGLLGHDPAAARKRLGDGYYEQQLVLQQLTQLTGRRYLSQEVGSALEQYRALMDGAATQAARFQLAVGVALSAEQIAALTTDMVWLVEQDVAGQRVLVPVVYLSQATAGRLQLDDTAAIAGTQVDISSSGEVDNRGQIRGVQGLSIDAASLRNTGSLHSEGLLWASAETDLYNSGQIGGGEVVLDAGRDLISEHGRGSSAPRIEAAQTLELSAGRDVSLRNTTLKAADSIAVDAGNDLRLEASQLDAGRHAVLSAGNDVVLAAQQRQQLHGDAAGSDTRTVHEVSRVAAGGELLISAGRDLRSEGAQLKAQGSIALDAGRDVQLDAVADEQRTFQSWREGRTGVAERISDQTVRGSRLEAGQDIVVSAGRDATLRGAKLHSESGSLAIAAGRDVNLLAAEETHSWEQQRQSKKSGVLSSTRTTSFDRVEERNAIGSTLSGEQIQLSAGRDITTRAVQAVATGDLVVAAGRNIDIGAAQDRRSEQHQTQTKKSGLIGGNGGIGFALGQQKISHEATVDEVAHVGSTLGSLQGRVDVQTRGGDVRITGSELLSAAGTSVVGRNVRIEAALDSSTVRERQRFKQSGINVSLKGGAADTVAAVSQSLTRASQVDDERLQALYVAKAGQAVFGAGGAGLNSLAGAKAQAGQGMADAANGQSGGGGMSLRVGIGASSSSTDAQYSSTTAKGSSLRSQGDIQIAALGDGQGNGGDIELIGSHIAGNDVALHAARDIRVLSAKELSEQRVRNKASSGEIGITVGSEAGIGVYVSASMAKGKGTGDGLTHAESTIDAAQQLRIVSGGDVTVQGGQLYGQQVLADIAGNLTLRSEQDSNRYQRRDQSAGIDVAVGTGGASVSGSYNQARIDSNYTSVVEQSGIQAGEGGFAIRVGGHTQLDGAAIASSADASRNLLVTGSLGASDLRNSAEYKASSVGFSASGGSNGGSVSPNIAPPQQDSASSTTRAGLADGLVLIGDGDTRALDSIERGVSELQQDGLAQIFDEQKLHQRMELGQVAGEVGFAAGKDLIAYQRDQAEAKALAAQQSMLEAQSSGDEARIQRARAELIAASDAVTAWSDGGIAKQITQALAGGLSGAAGGGDVLAAVGAVVVNEAALSQFATGLRRAGVDPDSAAHDSVMNLMGAVLGAVGGALVGDAEGGAAVGSAAQQFGYFDYREGRAHRQQQVAQALAESGNVDPATQAGINALMDNCVKLGCDPAGLALYISSPDGIQLLTALAGPEIAAHQAYGKGFNQLSQSEQEQVIATLSGTVSVSQVEHLGPSGEVIRTPAEVSPEQAEHNRREQFGAVLSKLVVVGGQKVETVVNWMGEDNAQTAALLMMAAVGGPVKAGAGYLFDAAAGEYIQTNKERYVVGPLSRLLGNVAFGAQTEDRLQQVQPASHATASILTDAAGASIGVIAAKTGAAGIVASSRGLKGKVDAADGSSVGDFFEGTHYTNKVKYQQSSGDLHGFPESVTSFQSEGILSRIKGGDGIERDMLRIPGEYRGKSGHFEFIKEPDGSINHRLFRPNR